MVNIKCTCKKCGKAFDSAPTGGHRLLCGDSTKIDEVQRLDDGRKWSLCFTSPPYNAGDNSLGGNKNRLDAKYVGVGDDRPDCEYLKLLVDFTTVALSLCRTVAINLQSLAGNKRTILEWMYLFREHFVDRMVWFKGQGQPAMAANVMNSRFEDIWILSPEKNPSRAIPTAKFHSTVSNVYEGRGASGENVAPEIHAATMPVHLSKHAIGSFDATGGIIFEPFAGTGTTIIAAEQLGRCCFGVDISGLYVDVAIQRWENFTNRKAYKVAYEPDNAAM